MNIQKYKEAITSKDRFITGLRDIDGDMIRVGDALLPNGRTDIFYVNYSSDLNCYYGLGTNNNIINENAFFKAKIVGVGILKSDFEEIFK